MSGTLSQLLYVARVQPSCSQVSTNMLSSKPVLQCLKSMTSVPMAEELVHGHMPEHTSYPSQLQDAIQQVRSYSAPSTWLTKWFHRAMRHLVPKVPMEEALVHGPMTDHTLHPSHDTIQHVGSCSGTADLAGLLFWKASWFKSYQLHLAATSEREWARSCVVVLTPCCTGC